MPLILWSPISMVVAKEFDSTTFFLSGNQLQLVYLKDLYLDPSYSIFLSMTWTISSPLCLSAYMLMIQLNTTQSLVYGFKLYH